MRTIIHTHGFKWIELKTKCLKFWANFVLQQEYCQDTGHFFEVDIKYQEELHYTHDQYPLAPEYLEIIPHHDGIRKS